MGGVCQTHMTPIICPSVMLITFLGYKILTWLFVMLINKKSPTCIRDWGSNVNVSNYLRKIKCIKSCLICCNNFRTICWNYIKHFWSNVINNRSSFNYLNNIWLIWDFYSVLTLVSCSSTCNNILVDIRCVYFTFD